MADLFASGRIADIVIGFMLVEMAVLLGLRGRMRRRLPVGEFAASIAAGLALVLALRSALAGSSWHLIALWLAAALAAHLGHLSLRLNAVRRAA